MDSHLSIKADIDLKPTWWQVIPVLVTNASDWPTKDGSSGITPTQALNAAVAAKHAIVGRGANSEGIHEYQVCWGRSIEKVKLLRDPVVSATFGHDFKRDWRARRRLDELRSAGGAEGGLQVHSSVLNVVLHDSRAASSKLRDRGDAMIQGGRGGHRIR